ncbi:hypothetical protein pb186bvf_006651 [Paramecium bursaria]
MEVSHQIIKIIKMVLITETEVEELKITLAENLRFDISDAFRCIDYNMKGYILASDVFRFMGKNGYMIDMKICEFWIYTITNTDKLTYKNFLEQIVPRYDRDAAIQCISRKLYSEIGSYKLTFYLEDSVSKLLFKELEYLKQLEKEKNILAQMVDWKFMEVFRLVAGTSLEVDKKILDQFLIKMGVAQLTDKDYIMFLKRFNRNDDKIIQRDEFSDAMFPSGYFLPHREEKKDGFYEYVMNQNQQLDKYLGNEQIKPDDDLQFRPEDHRIESSQIQELVRDDRVRQYINEDPQLAQSQLKQRIAMTFKPQESSPQPQQKPKIKKYVSDYELSLKEQKLQSQHQNQNQDLLLQFERGQGRQQQQKMQESPVAFNKSMQQSQYEEYIREPTNAELLLMK